MAIAQELKVTVNSCIAAPTVPVIALLLANVVIRVRVQAMGTVEPSDRRLAVETRQALKIGAKRLNRSWLRRAFLAGNSELRILRLLLRCIEALVAKLF